MDPAIQAYIQQCRVQGYTDDQIKQALLQRGWRPEQLTEYFPAQPTRPIPQPGQPQPAQPVQPTQPGQQPVRPNYTQWAIVGGVAFVAIFAVVFIIMMLSPDEVPIEEQFDTGFAEETARTFEAEGELEDTTLEGEQFDYSPDDAGTTDTTGTSGTGTQADDGAGISGTGTYDTSSYPTTQYSRSSGSSGTTSTSDDGGDDDDSDDNGTTGTTAETNQTYQAQQQNTTQVPECGSDQCWEDMFTNCTPATLETSFIEGIKYEHTILGPGTMGCRVQTEIEEHPDNQMVGLTQICEYDSSNLFVDEIADSSSCTGSLVDALEDDYDLE